MERPPDKVILTSCSDSSPRPLGVLGGPRRDRSERVAEVSETPAKVVMPKSQSLPTWPNFLLDFPTHSGTRREHSQQPPDARRTRPTPFANLPGNLFGTPCGEPSSKGFRTFASFQGIGHVGRARVATVIARRVGELILSKVLLSVVCRHIAFGSVVSWCLGLWCRQKEETSTGCREQPGPSPKQLACFGCQACCYGASFGVGAVATRVPDCSNWCSASWCHVLPTSHSRPIVGLSEW